MYVLEQCINLYIQILSGIPKFILENLYRENHLNLEYSHTLTHLNSMQLKATTKTASIKETAASAFSKHTHWHTTAEKHQYLVKPKMFLPFNTK